MAITTTVKVTEKLITATCFKHEKKNHRAAHMDVLWGEYMSTENITRYNRKDSRIN